MKINILVVGKIKEKYYKEACNEYLKRLSIYHNIKVIEVKDEKAPERLSNKQIEQVKEIEGDKLLKHITNAQFVIALDMRGKTISSIELSSKIDQIALSGKSDICFN